MDGRWLPRGGPDCLPNAVRFVRDLTASTRVETTKHAHRVRKMVLVLQNHGATLIRVSYAVSSLQVREDAVSLEDVICRAKEIYRDAPERSIGIRLALDSLKGISDSHGPSTVSIEMQSIATVRIQ